MSRTWAYIAGVAILIACLYSWWRQGVTADLSVFTQCHKLQQYTPESDAAFQKCMRDNGQNPDDWE